MVSTCVADGSAKVVRVLLVGDCLGFARSECDLENDALLVVNTGAPGESSWALPPQS